MDPKRIGIDMDDVICDFHGTIYDWCTDQFDLDPAFKYKRHIADMLTPDQNAQRTALLNDGNIFRDFAPKDGAVDVLKALTARHDVFIITAAMEHPNSLGPKFDWVQTHLPFFDPLQIVMCGHKYMANVDYLIDDTPSHFEKLDGEGIVFTAPKNLGESRYTRVDDWEQVANLFL